MKFQTYAEEEVKRLEQQIRKTEKELLVAPDGTLGMSKSGNKYKWFLLKKDNPGIRKYISKSERDYAQQLAKKKYNTKKLKRLKKELMAYKAFLAKANSYPHSDETELLNHDGYKDLLTHELNELQKELDRWMHDPFPVREKYKSALVIKVTNDLFVRSKSEAMIAKTLIEWGIPFRYECPLIIDNIVYYPDFTIRHPKTGEFFIWEHFGMIDNEQYFENAFSKVRNYIKMGYIPDKNLIMTFESRNNPLEYDQILMKMDLFFSDIA